MTAQRQACFRLAPRIHDRRGSLHGCTGSQLCHRHPTAAIFGMQTLRASLTALLSPAVPVSLRSLTWYIRGQYLPVTKSRFPAASHAMPAAACTPCQRQGPWAHAGDGKPLLRCADEQQWNVAWWSSHRNTHHRRGESVMSSALLPAQCEPNGR